MIRPASPTLGPPRHSHRARPRAAVETIPPEPHFTYGRAFWLSYAANLLILAAVGLLFRYADFITLLGGTEFHLGWIVGIGMVGSFFMRMALGSWIDRYGTRLLWLVRSALRSHLLRPFGHRQPHRRGHLSASNLLLLRGGGRKRAPR